MMHLTAFKYVYFNKLFNCYLYMVLVLHSTTKQYKQKGIQQKCIASQKLWESVNNPDYLFAFKSNLTSSMFASFLASFTPKVGSACQYLGHA